MKANGVQTTVDSIGIHCMEKKMSKYLLLNSTEGNKSYRFGKTQG